MKASKMTSSWHILSTIRVYKQSTSTRLLRLSSSASLEVKRNFFTSKSSQENWEGKVGVFLKFIYEMLALIRLKILCSSRLWWNSIVQIELHSHYCLFVKLDQFLGVLYSVEDLVGVYSVCLTIKKKISMRSGVATFVAMRHMNDRFIRLYRTIDLRDRYLSMYSTTLAMSHCGLNLVKGSRDNFWVVFFFKY